MAPKKEPTNADLKHEIRNVEKALRSELGSMGAIVMDLKETVNKLDDYMVEQKAIEKYKSLHPELPAESKINADLVKIAIGVITLAGAMIGYKIF